MSWPGFASYVPLMASLLTRTGPCQCGNPSCLDSRIWFRDKWPSSSSSNAVLEDGLAVSRTSAYCQTILEDGNTIPSLSVLRIIPLIFSFSPIRCVINVKNCRFITACKAHRSWHIKRQKLISRSTQVRGCNTHFLLYPRHLSWWN